MKENANLRKRIVEVSKILNTIIINAEYIPFKVNTEAAMIVMKHFTPESNMAMLDTNAEYNNLPRIGTDENTAFPAAQINLAQAIAYALCRRKAFF
jgi:hypothetical protein